MHEAADQEDAEAEQSGEHLASQRPDSLVVQTRTRSQAALVRESLVRCPGAADAGE
jgi:hypothetical protein